MMKRRKMISVIAALSAAAGMITGCGASAASTAPAAAETKAASAETKAASAETKTAEEAEKKAFKVGICNYVDDASLNQIVENIRAELEAQESAAGVKFEIAYDNCNADANVLSQIVANFIADDVDLMVGVATPVAMVMQSATEGKDIPVVFSAVSDPVSAGLTDSLDGTGTNITGTSDFLNTDSVMNLILAADPDVKTVGLLYDAGQDSSTTPVNTAKTFLEAKGIKVVEHTGTNVSEVQLAAEAMAADKVDAVFTPTDNTIMQAELSIYETLAEAGIPHYTGADSFALNGAFLGYGVDYANLGRETGKMVAEILVEGNNPGEMPIKTFDNGTATVNTEIAERLGFNMDDLRKVFAPYCTQVQEIVTAESFDELKKQ